MKLSEKILSRVKEQTGASEVEIMSVYKSCFKFVVQMIRNKGYEGIKMMFFGRFYVEPKHLKKIQELQIKKAFDEFSG